MSRPTSITVDLAALKHNARTLRSLTGRRRFMAVVKADAYGHGAVRCARALERHVDAFAVAFAEEAAQLREAGIQRPILALEGPFDSADAECIAALDLWTVVHTPEQVTLLAEAGATPAVWLKLDTGMHRLGLSTEQVPDVMAALADLGMTDITVMSHLAAAEAPDSELTRQQLVRWAQRPVSKPVASSLCNSAALALAPGNVDTWVRPGYALYGGQPGTREQPLPLKPVMRFESAVMALRDVAPGEVVGYGGTWRATRPSRIATVAAGYGDGYPRSADSGTPVATAWGIAPLVGRVSMDMLSIDVTDLDGVTIGTSVTLWGDSPSIDTVADHARTIGYELTTRMPARTPIRVISQ